MYVASRRATILELGLVFDAIIDCADIKTLIEDKVLVQPIYRPHFIHDLNLNNLNYLVKIGNINEVSIGHAIIVDSLLYGYEDTILKYLKVIGN